MRKDILINGIDCSPIFGRYGYTTNYKKINGAAGGTMLDGSQTVDVLAVKAVITFEIIPATEAEISKLVKMLYSADYCDVTYFDIRINDYRTIECIPSEMTAKHLMTNAFGDEMWRVEAVTFEER